MLEHLTRDQFAEHLNTKFKIYLTSEITVDAELIEVSEVRKRVRQEAYSLLFLVFTETPFEQAAYKVEHPALGSDILFLVPVDRGEKGIEYEVLFNRLTKD
jgi:predicted nucleic-acid-binding protein